MQVDVHVYPICRIKLEGVATIPDDCLGQKDLLAARAVQDAVEKAEEEVMSALSAYESGRGCLFQVGKYTFYYADDLDDALVDHVKGDQVVASYTVSPRKRAAQGYAATLASLIDDTPDDELKTMLTPIKAFLEAL